MRKRVDHPCRRCGVTIDWSFGTCRTCSLRRIFQNRYLSGATFAQSSVARARNKGLLADPRTLSCADCNGAAREYDHRDYNQPLVVSPVCRRCNARRGRAVPKQWAPGEWAAYIARTEKLNLASRAWVLQMYDKFKHELPDIFHVSPPTEAAA